MLKTRIIRLQIIDSQTMRQSMLVDTVAMENTVLCALRGNAAEPGSLKRAVVLVSIARIDICLGGGCAPT